jgi:hypothetical protein
MTKGDELCNDAINSEGEAFSDQSTTLKARNLFICGRNPHYELRSCALALAMHFNRRGM